MSCIHGMHTYMQYLQHNSSSLFACSIHNTDLTIHVMSTGELGLPTDNLPVKVAEFLQ